jgi:SET domain-containing protein
VFFSPLPAERKEGLSPHTQISALHRDSDDKNRGTPASPSDLQVYHRMNDSFRIIPPAVFVGATGQRGRGVFAGKDFLPGEEIETCPVIVLDTPAERSHIDRTRLYDYYFAWGEGEERTAIALGYGSLYNHSSMPNADHSLNCAAGLIRIFAYRPIRKGEEITINYTGAPDSRDPVWFVLSKES